MNLIKQDATATYHYALARMGIYATVIGLILIAPDVSAQVEEDNLLEYTLNTYRTNMQLIVQNIGGRLVNTFYLLAVIEFTWGMIKTYLDNGGLQTFLTEIITRIMFIGFFFYLFNEGPDIPRAIVGTFRTLATAAPNTPYSLTPDNVIDIGQNFLSQSWDVIRSGSILNGIGLMIGAIVVFIAMVILAAHLAVTLLEFYVVGYAGFVLLAFGASRWTHGYAVSYLKYAMSVGMKLFVITIIIAVVQVEMASYFTNVATFSMANVWAVSAFALFSVILAIIAPQSVMGMMSGVSIATGAGAAAAAGAVGGAAGAAAGAAGGALKAGASAVSGAAGAASAGVAAARLGSAASKAGGGAMGGAGAVAKEVGGGAVSAGASALSKAFPVKESAGGKLAARMNNARTEINKKSEDK